MLTGQQVTMNGMTVAHTKGQTKPGIGGQAMKVTVEIPDNTLVMTYQYVFDDDKSLFLKIQQHVLDSEKLKEMQEGKR